MEELFSAMIAKGKNNMFKAFPKIAPKKSPKLQQELLLRRKEIF
jgi:hypothetical protein